MNISYSNNLTAQFISQLYVKIVQQILLRNIIITDGNIQMIVIENLVQTIHVLTSYRISSGGHTLTIFTEEITCNSDDTILKLSHGIQRHRRNFSPAFTIFVTVTDNTEQVVIAHFIFHQKGQSLVRDRILAGSAGGININVTAVNSLQGRQALFLAFLVEALAAGLEFKDAKHSTMVSQRNCRSIVIGSSR